MRFRDKRHDVLMVVVTRLVQDFHRLIFTSGDDSLAIDRSESGYGVKFARSFIVRRVMRLLRFKALQRDTGVRYLAGCEKIRHNGCEPGPLRCLLWWSALTATGFTDGARL